jgi:hypothetical protein
MVELSKVEFGQMGRRKKTEIPEEVTGPSDEGQYPPKEHHWSDDGLRYCVMMEFDDGYPGYRHYGAFFETEDLALAKQECLAQFKECNRTTLIIDRAERHKEIVRHEVEAKEIKDGEIPTTRGTKPKSK